MKCKNLKKIILLIVGVNILSPIIVNGQSLIVESDNQVLSEEVTQGKVETSEKHYATGVGKSNPTDIVNIPDENFKNELRDQLGKAPTEEITVADMEGLTELMLSNAMGSRPSFSDLTGIEYAVNLKKLDIGSNDVKDLNPIKNLTKLEFLEIYINDIEDLSPLANLTNLKRLDAYGNQISDLTPLSGLTNLTIINVGINNISDITPLSNLNNLNYLDIYTNNITSLSGVENMSNLLGINFSNNQITDLSPLENDKTLLTINGSNNTIDNVDVLQNLNKLEYLDLKNNNISDITQIQNLRNLESLYLNNNNNIEDVSALKNLSSLKYLYLDNNAITNIGSVPKSVSALSARDQVATVDVGEITPEQFKEYENMIVDKDGVIIPLDFGVMNPEGDTLDRTWNSSKNKFNGSLNFTYKLYTEAPEINGTKDLELTLGDTIDLMNGVIATDAEDGDLTSAIVVDDSKVDYNKTGSYDVIYSVTDSDGKTDAKTITLTIVRDLTKPVKPSTPEIGSVPTIDGTKDLELTLGNTINLMNNVSASDAEDGDLTASIVVDDSKVDYNKTGSYNVTYSVTDSDGNTTTKTITLTIVRDLVKPVNPITPESGSVPTIDGTKDLKVKLGDTIDLLAGVTASDAEDGDLTDKIVVDDSKVDYTKAGKYEVTYLVTDSDGNTTTITIIIEIIDEIDMIDITPAIPINPEKPEVVDPINPEKPEVVDPVNPEEIDPVDPEVVDPEKPQVVVPETGNDDNKLTDTGIMLKINYVIIMMIGLIITIIIRRRY